MPDTPPPEGSTPPPPSTPEPPADAPQTAASSPGFSVDLTTRPGKASRPRAKTAAAPVLVRKTIDLSTKRAPQPKAVEDEPSSRKHQKAGRKGAKGAPSSGRSRRSRPSGHSLADLLDPDTLARLRGDD